ncbi:MAG TPA: PEGA domain-containing protein, partial [Myxococcaceae bacterium]
QPSYQLDPDYFMPSIRQRFDRLRKELQATRRVRVEVKSLPAGAEIFLDGVKQGTTPAALEVWPGDYELAVVRDGQRSLPHQLAARRENAILVDLQFEGAIQLDRDPCFAARAGDERTRLAGALKIATLLGVDAMVALQLERSKTGPGSLVATVMDTQTAQVVRYGGIKLQGGPQQPPAALAELAKFVLTGESGKALVAVDVVKPLPGAGQSATPVAPAPSKPSPAAGAAAANPSPALAPRPPVVATTAAPVPSEVPGWLPKGWRGDAVLGFGSAGAGAAVAGGILLVVGKGTMDVANNTYPSSSVVVDIAKMRDTAYLQQGLGVAGLVMGGVGLVTAGVLWRVDPFEPLPAGGRPSLSVGASRAGASVQVSGTF